MGSSRVAPEETRRGKTLRAGPIVCGVDASAESRSALGVSADLADRLGSRLVLVTVRPAPDLAPAHAAVGTELLRSQTREAGERLLADMTSELLGGARWRALIRRTEGRVQFGEPAAGLHSVAVELEARLLVVGARGRGPVAGAMLGRVSNEILREPPCPVLVVPPHAELGERGGQSIVCGVDESSPALWAVGAAAQLADDLDLRLVLAHVDDQDGRPLEYSARLDAPRRSRLRLLHRAMRVTDDLSPEAVLLGGDPDEALADLAETEGAEVIALGTRCQGGLKAAVLGSVSRSLAASAPRPVLIVGEPSIGGSE